MVALFALTAILGHDPGEPVDAQPTRGPVLAQIEDPEESSLAEALLDEAHSLTPTEVLLDERARERWLLQLADLRRQAQDPGTPAPEREALVALLRHLEALGI